MYENTVSVGLMHWQLINIDFLPPRFRPTCSLFVGLSLLSDSVESGYNFETNRQLVCRLIAQCKGLNKSHRTNGIMEE